MSEEEKPIEEKKPLLKFSPLEACERLAASLVIFLDTALVLEEVVDDLRHVMATLCPGQLDFSLGEAKKKDSEKSPWTLETNGLK